MQWASLGRQRTVVATGRSSGRRRRCRRSPRRLPVVIVGEVVRLRETLSWSSSSGRSSDGASLSLATANRRANSRGRLRGPRGDCHRATACAGGGRRRTAGLQGGLRRIRQLRLAGLLERQWREAFLRAVLCGARRHPLARPDAHRRRGARRRHAHVARVAPAGRDRARRSTVAEELAKALIATGCLDSAKVLVVCAR
ncbi:MAG: hypothetical protein MZV63_19490 [Marinilabiliales bacterium]|nr:hypothetical protein [Marinilabiliales bacterium]